jgi:hypothetical protein
VKKVALKLNKENCINNDETLKKLNPITFAYTGQQQKLLENKFLYLLYFIFSFSSYAVNPILNLVSVPCLVGGMSMHFFRTNGPASLAPSVEWGAILATCSHRKNCFTASDIDKVTMYVAIYSDIS